ncbi:MAG: zinc-binding dehydrogenase [Halorientalis sp.]
MTQRTVRLHSPGDLRVDQVETPSLWPGGVRVDVSFCGICGSDLHEYELGPVPIRAEDTDHRIPESSWSEWLPKPMGHEIAGTVSEVGEDVADVSVGDRVTLALVVPCGECRYCEEAAYHLCERTSGTAVGSPGFADTIVVPEETVVPVPDRVSLRHAALTEPLAVSLHGVRRSGLGAGDTVAVFGAGPIGLGLVACARLAGAREIHVSEPRAARREAARELGADAVYDPASVDARDRIVAATDRVDVGFECAGIGATLTDALRATKYGGTTVVLSVFEEEAEIHPNDVMQAERDLVGSFAFRGGPVADRGEFPAVLSMMADGRLDPEPLVSGELPLQRVTEGFERLADPDSDAIKLLVRPE